MDRRERYESLAVSLLAAQEGWQSHLWTAMPGIVQSFDASKMTVQVKVAIQSKFIDPAGNATWDSPLLVDCPVLFQGGGGLTLTFPIAAGDEALVIFASRCIDFWWQSGGVQPQAELRMHDLSDGFALVGMRSVPRLVPSISTNSVQLRNDAGDTYIEIKQDKTIKVETPAAIQVHSGGNLTATVGGNLSATISGTTDVTSSGNATVTAPTIQLTGNVQVTGNLSVSGTMTNNGTNVGRTHVHSGVSTGPSNTGGPL